jgi:hypothetical protein
LNPVRYFFLLLVLSLLLSGCSSSRQSAGAERHYRLTGKVLAVNPSKHTATIDAAAIPNFMEAMIMDYPIKSRADFEKLHPGERITATVNVREDGYDLSNIHTENASK